MKRMSIFIPLLLLVFLFTACGGSEEWKAHVNDTYASVPVYKTGQVLSAQFGDNANIKIDDDKYSNFEKYIDQLKKSSFEYYSISNIPENFELNAGQAVWRGSNGDVFLQLIYSESGSENYEAFGCNVQIFGFSEDPWKDVVAKSESKDKKSGKKSNNDQTTEQAETSKKSK